MIRTLPKMASSSWVQGLKKGLNAVAEATQSAVSKATEAAKEFSSDFASAKAYKEYKLGPMVATAGPQGCWKIHTAVPNKPGVAAPC